MSPELQDIIARHLLWTPPEEIRLPFLVLALCGEAGELANLVKKDMRGDSGHAMRALKIVDELADVGAYTLMIAAHLGVDLEQAITKKVKEVEQRPQWKEFISRHQPQG